MLWIPSLPLSLHSPPTAEFIVLIVWRPIWVNTSSMNFLLIFFFNSLIHDSFIYFEIIEMWNSCTRSLKISKGNMLDIKLRFSAQCFQEWDSWKVFQFFSSSKASLILESYGINFFDLAPICSQVVAHCMETSLVLFNSQY